MRSKDSPRVVTSRGKASRRAVRDRGRGGGAFGDGVPGQRPAVSFTWSGWRPSQAFRACCQLRFSSA